MNFNKLRRLFFVWKAGKIPLAKKMKAWREYRRWFFAYYGWYPLTVKQINEFLNMRHTQVKASK